LSERVQSGEVFSNSVVEEDGGTACQRGKRSLKKDLEEAEKVVKSLRSQSRRGRLETSALESGKIKKDGRREKIENRRKVHRGEQRTRHSVLRYT